MDPRTAPAAANEVPEDEEAAVEAVMLSLRELTNKVRALQVDPPV